MSEQNYFGSIFSRGSLKGIFFFKFCHKQSAYVVHGNSFAVSNAFSTMLPAQFVCGGVKSKPNKTIVGGFLVHKKLIGKLPDIRLNCWFRLRKDCGDLAL